MKPRPPPSCLSWKAPAVARAIGVPAFSVNFGHVGRMVAHRPVL